MDISGVEVGGFGCIWGRGVVFARGQLGEEAVEMLHVGNVAAEPEGDAAIEGKEAVDVGKACERAIGCCREKRR